MGSKLRARLSTRRALVVIVGLAFALGWVVPSYGASAFKLAVKALGRANTAVHDSAVAVNTSNNANSTANKANSTANTANTNANSAKSAAATAQSTANTALSTANAAAHVVANTTRTFNAGSLATDTCTTDTFTQLGVASTDDVIVTAPSTLPDGIIAQGFALTNQLELKVCNLTSGTIPVPNLGYKLLVLH
jgi:hypothetical protein